MEVRMGTSFGRTLGLSLSRIACVTSRRSAAVHAAISSELRLERIWISGDTSGYPVFRIEAVQLARIARTIDPDCSIEIFPLRR